MEKNYLMIEFPKNKKYEFFYFPILLILFFVTLSIDDKLIKDNFNSLLFIAIGFLHILASNILAYAYNLSYVALLLPLRLKPWFVKIVGIILILNSIRLVLT